MSEQWRVYDRLLFRARTTASHLAVAPSRHRDRCNAAFSDSGSDWVQAEKMTEAQKTGLRDKRVVAC
jgi:hypothetical protein